MPIGHGFSFFGHGKSWKIDVKKDGAPCFLMCIVFIFRSSAVYVCVSVYVRLMYCCS